MDPLVVTIEDPGQANLLELVLASLLERRLADPRARRHARALAGTILVEAGAMRATLAFRDDHVVVSRAAGDLGATARLSGSLAAIVDAALGRHRAANVMRGNLHASGRPRALWHLLTLLRSAGVQ